MKILIALMVAFCGLFLGACAQTPEVVTTRISYDRTAGTLNIQSPKDVTIGSLDTVRAEDGSLTVNLKDYAATANPEALKAAQAQAQLQAQLLQAIFAMATRTPTVQAPATTQQQDIPRATTTPAT